jgi:hypothetical protein
VSSLCRFVTEHSFVEKKELAPLEGLISQVLDQAKYERTLSFDAEGFAAARAAAAAEENAAAE